MKSKTKALIDFVSGVLFVIAIILFLNWYCGVQLSKGNIFPGFGIALVKNSDRPLSVPADKGISPRPPPTLPENLRNKEPYIPAPPDLTRIHENNRYKLIDHGKTVLDVSIIKDEHGWRITPGEEGKKAEKFLLFIGDSQVLGQAVNDNETLPAVVAKSFPDYRVYNKGIGFGYPGEIMEKLSHLPEGDPAEKSGIALFFFYDYQILRNMGSFTTLSLHSMRKPYYYENEKGEIVRGKSFIQENPSLTKWKIRAANNNIIKYFQYDLKPRENDFRFQAKLLAQMKTALEKKGAKKFIVVMMPDHVHSFTRRLLPHLEKEGIFYLDFSHWRSELFVPGKNMVDYDGHHSALFYEYFGKELSKVLRPLL